MNYFNNIFIMNLDTIQILYFYEIYFIKKYILIIKYIRDINCSNLNSEEIYNINIYNHGKKQYLLRNSFITNRIVNLI